MKNHYEFITQWLNVETWLIQEMAGLISLERPLALPPSTAVIRTTCSKDRNRELANLMELGQHANPDVNVSNFNYTWLHTNHFYGEM